MTDAHHHLWNPAARAYPWMAGAVLDPIRREYTVDDLRAAAGPDVTATVLVQTVSTSEETADFLAVARESDGYVAGVVGWTDLLADLDDPNLADPLLVGIRHQVENEPDPDWLLRPAVQRSLTELGRRGLVYDLLVRVPSRPAALVTARAVDGMFVLDHAGKPDIAGGEWQPWADWITELARCPNVVCKLSGLTTEADWTSWLPSDIRPYADHVLTAFGSDRVLFGSDWPVCDLAGGYAEVQSLAEVLLTHATLTERDAVLNSNARRVYGLK
ncbi:amidohydrolase family protein [Actinokineospora sp. HUAS TT18]|uniref:amidohydrolase family protein n=1 Tax=Actinokineospora sp. HUAS TT18 TaxID=3447451 RepID=UPI003F525E2F